MLKNAAIPLVTILVFILAFILKTKTDFDSSLFPYINQSLSVLDLIGITGSYLGDGRFAAIILILALSSRSEMLFKALIGAVVVHFGVQYLKLLFQLPRPEYVLGHAVHVLGPHLKAEDYAFPSGHAATLGLYGSFLWQIAPKWLVRAPLLCALMVASLGRVIAGAHWPTDVLAGLSFGVLVATIVLLLPDPGRYIRLSSLAISVVICLLLLYIKASWFLFYPLFGYLEIPFLLAAISFSSIFFYRGFKAAPHPTAA